LRDRTTKLTPLIISLSR